MATDCLPSEAVDMSASVSLHSPGVTKGLNVDTLNEGKKIFPLATFCWISACCAYHPYGLKDGCESLFSWQHHLLLRPSGILNSRMQEALTRENPKNGQKAGQHLDCSLFLLYTCSMKMSYRVHLQIFQPLRLS